MQTESEQSKSETERKELIKQVFEVVAKSLVDNPDELKVSITQGDQTCVYEVRCARGDTGKLVGKRGVMAEALRTIMKSLSAKNRVRAILEICD